MKASNILFSARGQIAGALSRLADGIVRLEVLQKVSDDASSGVAPLEGLSESNAQTLAMCLSREVDLARAVVEQLRSGYSLLQACASSMPPPDPTAVDLTRSGEIWIELEA